MPKKLPSKAQVVKVLQDRSDQILKVGKYAEKPEKPKDRHEKE